MTELAELEKRIAEAIQRIRAGVEGLQPAPEVEMVPADEADALASQLSEVTAALTEATEALEAERARASELETALQAALDEAQSTPAVPDLSNDLAATEAELRSVQATVQELQSANAALRQSAMDHISDPELINRSLAADLEAVQIARLSELRDIDAILATLDPIVQGASHA